MNYKLDHIALSCKDLNESVEYYEKYFGGKPTAIRKAGDGHSFCFVNISGAAAIQLIESASDPGIDHNGFVTAAKDLKAKNARIATVSRWRSGCRADRVSSTQT